MSIFYTVYGIAAVALLVLLRFIFSPYFTWRRARQQHAGVENVRVITKQRTCSFNEYRQMFIGKRVQLSIVVPAYNEQDRIGKMLTSTIEYFLTYGLTFEIIVVNDASKDNTISEAQKFMEYKAKEIDLKIVNYTINRGKGGAVRLGMLLAKGDYALMADADDATQISDFKKVYEEAKKINTSGHSLVAGSRNHLVRDVVKQRKWYRNILMHVSNFIVNFVCGVRLKDTQCGFKVFSAQTYNILFNVVHLERWAFDVELFMIANHYKIPTAELPVNWRDVEGSKLNVIEASITMARDYLMVRLLYLLGVWSYKDSVLGAKVE